MNTDREFLELASKAIGIELLWPTIEGLSPRIGGSGSDLLLWNPLTDDGDALRLAVKLGMNLWLSETECLAEVGRKIGVCENNYDGSAARRAIVRAAAEIGKQMP